MVDKFSRCFGEDFRRVKFCVRQFPCHLRDAIKLVPGARCFIQISQT